MGGSPVSRTSAIVSKAPRRPNARLPPPTLGESPKLVGFQRAEGERLALHRGATRRTNERPRTEARGRSPNNAGSDLLSHTAAEPARRPQETKPMPHGKLCARRRRCRRTKRTPANRRARAFTE